MKVGEAQLCMNVRAMASQEKVELVELFDGTKQKPISFVKLTMTDNGVEGMRSMEHLQQFATFAKSNDVATVASTIESVTKPMGSGGGAAAKPGVPQNLGQARIVDPI